MTTHRHRHHDSRPLPPGARGRAARLAACALAFLAAVLPAVGQAEPPSAPGFADAASEIRFRLDQALAELDRLYEEIAAEKLPLARELSALEQQLLAARAQYQQTTRTLDSRNLDVSNLRNEIKARQDEVGFLSTLLGQYVQNFETRLHIAEVQRFQDLVVDARDAPENDTLTDQQQFEAQAALVEASIDRLFGALGGTRFDGSAVGDDGLVKQGTFVQFGPMALFRSSDGAYVGTVEQRINSTEPAVVGFETPENALAAAEVVTSATGGLFPMDPTLGNAHVVEKIEETFVEHVKKGGPVMVPIFALAGAALLVAMFKGLFLFRPMRPSPTRVRNLLQAVARGEHEGALTQARELRGPAGKMLEAGAEHQDEPRELIEEVMYEQVLTTRLRLNRMLPFIAICAAAAPLLGLLGTVTGIINTFKLITVFGSGDVKTLSGGISEALITTKFGLITAIPALLLHAFLARRAKGIVDDMEKSAIAFVNEVVRYRARHGTLEGQRGGMPASAAAASAPAATAPVAVSAGAGAYPAAYASGPSFPVGAGYPGADASSERGD